MEKFIGHSRKSDNAVYIRRDFNIRSGLKRATLYSTAIGVYKGFLNEKPFSNDVLSPGWVDFYKRIPYYGYDLTDRVKTGKNCLGFIIGNGWACGNIAWFGKNLYSDSVYDQSSL